MPHALSPSPRAPLLVLLPATALAAFGLGMLLLAATAPPPRVATLPSPGHTAAQATGADDPARSDEAATDVTNAVVAWAPLFGLATPEPVLAPPEPEPELEPEPEVVFYDTSAYVLRGLVYHADGGWALLETDEGSLVIRQGDFLPDGEEVLFITQDGVEIEVDGDPFFISFDEDMDRLDGPMQDQIRDQMQDQAPRPVAPRRSLPGSLDRSSRGSSSGPGNQFGIGTVGR